MKSYLVGGAVRDELLGREVHDEDFVVTGATIDQMKADGFTQVGADFPVFLHPQTKQEYALARTERKSGKGHKGFTVEFTPQVTLEEDLLRRDLTINAIAKDENGQYVDPFGGQRDIDRRVLRHVSEAFVEDPLRVLRVARFAAQLHGFGFQVHQDTLALMSRLAQAGELTDLTAERVFKETEKALDSDYPGVYFEVLRVTDALPLLFPGLDNLIATGRFEQALKALETASNISRLPEIRWAALVQALEDVQVVDKLNSALKVPTRYSVLAEKVVQQLPSMRNLLELEPAQILTLLERLDAFRREALLEQFIVVCRAAIHSQLPQCQPCYPEGELLHQAYLCCREVVAAPFVAQGFKGAQIKAQISAERIRRIAEMRRA